MAFPVDHIKKLKENRTFSEIMQDDIQCLMTFPEFYETTNKNKVRILLVGGGGSLKLCQ